MIVSKQNTKFLETHPSFCVLPFVHLVIQAANFSYYDHIKTANVSSLCCSAPAPIKVSLNGSLDDIIHHEDFKQDREMFYANKLPVQCENVCSLNYTTKTKRKIVNEIHMETILYENVFKQPTVKVIDYKFGNECNLACRMCSAGSSDQIANLATKAISSIDNTKKLIEFGINDIASQPADPTNAIWTLDSKVIIEKVETLKGRPLLRRGVLSDIVAVKKALPNLNELQFSGGEPFVSKDVEDILLAAIETGDNKHIDLQITTNGTKFVEEKLDIFLQFKKIKFIVSIDGVGPTYDYIRYPFSFKLIEKRLRGIVDYIIKNNLKKKVELHFACVGILYNLYDYEQLYNFLNSIFNKITETPVVMSIMSGIYGKHDQPHALSWNNIPNDLLNDAWLSYKDMHEGPGIARQYQWYNEFKRYITNRTQDAKPEGITFAKEHTLLLDELHERKYSDYLHPKLSKYIDSIK
jgi:organic radical activating enzyme